MQDDPFLPLEMEDCSLSVVLVDKGLAKYSEEEKVVEAEEQIFKLSNSDNDNEKKEAGGTFVDDCGRIYLYCINREPPFTWSTSCCRRSLFPLSLSVTQKVGRSCRSAW